MSMEDNIELSRGQISQAVPKIMDLMQHMDADTKLRGLCVAMGAFVGIESHTLEDAHAIIDSACETMKQNVSDNWALIENHKLFFSFVEAGQESISVETDAETGA
jgi:hypothetical protein